MGKTSILSALELGLTGRIAHLENKSSYRDFLTNFAAHSGSIELVAEHLPQYQGNGKGSLTFSPEVFESNPVLSSSYASFFSERCFLPQGVLGRLLEIYDEQSSNTNSRLTQFVKELLRLDPLDALAEGLSHAFNITRVRKIAPAYKQLEALLENYESQASRLQENIDSAFGAINTRLTRLNDMLSSLTGQPSKLEMGLSVITLRKQLADGQSDEKKLSEAVQNKSQVASLITRLTKLGEESADADIAEKERAEAQLSAEFESWFNGPGSQIGQAVTDLRPYNSELSTSDSDLATVMDEALHWCKSEISRCNRVLEQHTDSNEKLITAQGVVQRASTRIREINELLAAGAIDARTLANALAGIAPHVEANLCPVCSRDYSEVHTQPLTTHIAATIANLTSEAGRLQSLAAERAAENERLTIAQRDLVVAERGTLDSDSVLVWRQRLSTVTSINGRLAELQIESIKGRQIGTALANARREVSEIRKAIHSSATLLPEIQMIVERITKLPTTNFPTLQEGLREAEVIILNRISEIEARLTLRVSLASELDQYERELELHTNRKEQQQKVRSKSDVIKKTMREVGEVRDTAKLVAAAASGVRSGIVRDVFSGSLNTIWRDLFVRLAPSEQFIPQFQLPPHDDGKVEAVLETLHKSGLAGGAPGTMLSQGNLNTAALTLFLALNLSVPSQLPWLVLDDPVQSMDDLHVAQFAALLRTLSKGLGKQLIVAVHERALFDYLTLELSPAFAGDSLVTVEISRNFQGETIADPRFFEFEVDKAVVT
ncbi:exonuclease SbcC [Noviherbaspirillum suwonense]|uniref:Exonuclease SbcC n=2 Tax=Noviherbaspirillum suwonense TaxID=1224511 RepID=A0ABY1QC70_9BURK|nr:exonuclease SbcC [Noviherbaspirillum suwonense]